MPVSKFMDLAVPGLMALLLVSGAFVAFLEGRAFALTPGDPALRFAALREGRQPVGISSHSMRYRLADCQTALAGAYGRLQPEDARMQAAGTCRDTALDTIRAAPLDGFAHAVAARASAALGERDAAIAHLLRSGEAFPYEGWMAHQRVLTVREWGLDADEAVARLHRRDLGVMGMSDGGRAWLARLYLAEPDSRALLVSAIDGLEERHRRAFLRAVRSLGATR